MDFFGKELISVIIPIYQRPHFLEKTIASVLGQSHENIEILLVDDGSNTPISESYSPSDKRVKIITLEKNYGAQYARNIGIKNAKANWIAFIDSDDEWLPEKLSFQLQNLIQTNYELAVTDGYYRTDNTLIPMSLCSQFKSGDISKQILKKPSLMFQGLLVHKKCLQQIGYLDENVPAFHEWETIIRLAKEFKVLILRENLFIYNVHNEFSISKDTQLRKKGYKYIIDKHFDIDSPSYQKHLEIINKLDDDPYLLELL